MLSKGKKLFRKASHLGVKTIYTLVIFAKTLSFFCLAFVYFYNFFEFFIYIIFYIFIVIFSILRFGRPEVVKEM